MSVLLQAPRLGLLPNAGSWWKELVYLDAGRGNFLIGQWWAAAGVEALAFLARRRLPVPAFFAAVLAVGFHMGDPSCGLSPIDLTAGFTLYTAALAARTSRGSLALLGAGLLGITTIAMTWQLVWIPRLMTPPPFGMATVWAYDIWPVAGLFPAWLAAHARRGELLLFRERAQHLERERDQRAALAAAEERARINREFHDVIGHNLSVMVIQTQAAVGVLDQDPNLAREALTHVVSVGQGGLADMRNLLRAGADPASRTPPDGLAQLPELIDRVRQAGLPTSLRTSPDLPHLVGLPHLVDLAAYRIIQEALTNTIKHGGDGATATVTLDCHDDALHVDITDTGPGPCPGTARGLGTPEHGNGLRGIRERATALAGTAETGPLPTGGFRVHATLPLERVPVAGSEKPTSTQVNALVGSADRRSRNSSDLHERWRFGADYWHPTSATRTR
ncbi:MAG TPA: histidine kinase [Kineosporiaceae bacterium]|nr:histidine kinase [Kineosporiaceae bacterium]